MLSMRKIRRQYGGLVCRACLNDMSGVHLRRRNCVYAPAPGPCARCHIPQKNLVRRLKLSGKLKTMI